MPQEQAVNIETTSIARRMAETVEYLRLADARVRFCADACLSLFAPQVKCTRCADTCPVDALRIGEAGPRIAGPCLACGHCAAECPTGALRVEGFELPVRLPPGDWRRRIECWKVPRSETGTSALRVPCLGGIGLEQTLEYALAVPEGFDFVDRGWCPNCTAGSKTDLMAAILNTARGVLAETGCPESLLPRRVHDPLPPERMPAAIPEPGNAASAGRRNFLLRWVGAVPTMAPDAIAPTVRRAPRSQPKRKRLLAAGLALASARGRDIAPSLFPALHASAACRDHGICVRSCPTGALTHYKNEIESGIEFRAAACVACGACVAACPEHALAFAHVSRTPQKLDIAATLTSFPRGRCRNCLRPFAVTDDSGCCPECGRHQGFAQDLFGARLPGEYSSVNTISS